MDQHLAQAQALVKEALSQANSKLAVYQPVEIVAYTLLSLLVISIVNKVISALQEYGLKGAVMILGLEIIKLLPGGKGQIEKENAKMKEKMSASVMKENEGPRHTDIPEKGMSEDELLKLLSSWKAAEDKHWKCGLVSGAVYHGGDKVKEILNKAYNMFSIANPLHPELFPYVRKMEAEVVRMSVSLFHGDSECCGTMTSGGTESILMAMKAYRDWGKSRGITRPQIVAAISAHAAFNKAAHYFNIELVSVPVDPKTYRIDVRAMEKAITKNTVVIVGSAYPFPQGCMDPITDLAALARKYKLNLHVDACLGGYLLPYLPELGYKVPDWDFKIPEVTSISADPHKYGFASKGCSVVLYRNSELRQHQYFVATDWTGGIYASPSVAGSRAGGVIASCWAAMIYMGKEGYRNTIKEIMGASKKIQEGISSIPELRVCGNPEGSVVAFETVDASFDIYKVVEAMTKRGWHLNNLQFPRSAHLCVTYLHVPTADKFNQDLKESVEEVKANPKAFKDGTAAIYGMAESIPDRSMVATMAKQFIDALYTV